MTAQGTTEVHIESSSLSIVMLRGEHDLNSKLRVMRSLMMAGMCDNILVDLTQCAFVDSTVVNAFLRASSAMQKRGGALELVVPPGAHHVRRTLELMDLLRLLPNHHTRADAIAALEQRVAASTTANATSVGALVRVVDDASREAMSRPRAA